MEGSRFQAIGKFASYRRFVTETDFAPVEPPCTRPTSTYLFTGGRTLLTATAQPNRERRRRERPLVKMVNISLYSADQAADRERGPPVEAIARAHATILASRRCPKLGTMLAECTEQYTSDILEGTHVLMVICLVAALFFCELKTYFRPITKTEKTNRRVGRRRR